MKSDGCVVIECVFNDALKKGLCIGVCGVTRSYSKDVIRLCWVSKKTETGKPCEMSNQAQMTPAESVGIGVGLIRASIVGESLLKNLEEKKSSVKT